MFVYVLFWHSMLTWRKDLRTLPTIYLLHTHWHRCPGRVGRTTGYWLELVVARCIVSCILLQEGKLPLQWPGSCASPSPHTWIIHSTDIFACCSISSYVHRRIWWKTAFNKYKGSVWKGQNLEEKSKTSPPPSKWTEGWEQIRPFHWIQRMQWITIKAFYIVTCCEGGWWCLLPLPPWARTRSRCLTDLPLGGYTDYWSRQISPPAPIIASVSITW